MKKAILRILMVIFGLNVFTACYGMPPGDLDPIPVPEEQGQEETKAQAPSDEDIDESDEAENDGLQLN